MDFYIHVGYDCFQKPINANSTIVKTVTAKTSVIESPVDKRQTNAELVATTLSDPQSRTSQFRELCIRRDDYRCVITKQMDFVHWEKLNEPADIMAGDLEAAHIIPFSLASWRDNTVILFTKTSKGL